jgi:hypothetical protein
MRSGALALGELGATMDSKPTLIFGGGVAGLTLKRFSAKRCSNSPSAPSA